MMKKDEVLEFLLQNGEKTSAQMSFPHISRMLLRNILVNWCNQGFVNRRMVPSPKGDVWAYTAINKPNRKYQFKNESDPVYFLRNLPREEFLDYSIDLLEAAL